MRLIIILLSTFFYIYSQSQEKIELKTLLSDSEKELISGENAPVSEFNIYQPLISSSSLLSEDINIRYPQFQTGIFGMNIYARKNIFNIPYIQYFSHSAWNVSDKFMISGGVFGKDKTLRNFNPDNLRGFDIDFSYHITDRLSFNMSGYKYLNNYSEIGIPDAIVNQGEIYPGLVFKINENIKIKGGLKREFSVQKRGWVNSYSTDLRYNH